MTALFFFALSAGVFSWTLLEYLLHRFAFHHRRSRPWLRREHMQHHATPDYFAPTVKKIAAAVPVIGGLALLFAPILGLPLGATYACGVGLGWFLYELLHRRLHVAGPRNGYGAWARRHHLHHHFVNAKMNHGVTTDLWDRVFGTLDVPERITVPRRHVHAFAWLLDGDDIAAPYRSQYQLR